MSKVYARIDNSRVSFDCADLKNKGEALLLERFLVACFPGSELETFRKRLERERARGRDVIDVLRYEFEDPNADRYRRRGPAQRKLYETYEAQRKELAEGELKVTKSVQSSEAALVLVGQIDLTLKHLEQGRDEVEADMLVLDKWDEPFPTTIYLTINGGGNIALFVGENVELVAETDD